MSRLSNFKKMFTCPKRPREQKIIIPKGCIDPNHTTVIEIPERCENMSTIIAGSSANQNTSYVSDIDEDEENYEEYPNFGQLSMTYGYPSSYSNKSADQSVYDEALEEETVEEASLEDLRNQQNLSYQQNAYRNNTQSNFPRHQQEYPYQNKEIEERQHRGHSQRHGGRKHTQQTEKGQKAQSYNNPVLNEIAQQSKVKNARIHTVLDKLDAVELSGLERDLKHFQNARRKLLFDVSNMKMF